MESDKYICIREETPQGASLTVVDLTNNNEVSRIPMGAESTIMNPESKIVALRKGPALQVFNLDTKSKVSSFKLPDNSVVSYWRWIDAKTIAIITQTSVFHWCIEGESNPRKVMDRHPNLAQCQIINYRVSPDQKWCMIVGIGKGAENSIAGTIQLYSVDNKKSQILASHCGGFVNVDNQTAKGQLFTFIEKKGPQPACKYYAMEVGKPGGFKIKPVEFAFPAEAAKDFPVSMEIDEKRCLSYVMTKMGFVYMFDIMTGTLLARSRISPEPIFLTTKVSTGGVIGLSAGKGAILKVTLVEANLVPFVMNALKNMPVALELASRLNLPGADDIFMKQFSTFMQQGNIKAAAHVAYKSPATLIRNENTIRKLQQMPAQPGQQPPFVTYIGAIVEIGRLNEIETIEFCKIILQQGKTPIIEKWMKEDKITCSERLGDMVAPVDVKLAMAIYFKGNCHEKVVATLIREHQYEKVLQYCQQKNYTPDYNALIRNMVSQDPKAAEGFAKMLAKTNAETLDVQGIADTFYTMGLVQECTGFLLEVLQKRGDLPEDGELQTRVLETSGVQLEPVDTETGQKLLFGAGILAQCTVIQPQTLTLCEDAYSTRGDFQPQWQEQEYSMRLDAQTLREPIRPSFPAQASAVLDCRVYPDAMALERTADGVIVHVPLRADTVYTDADGAVQSESFRTEVSCKTALDEDCACEAVFQLQPEGYAAAGSGAVELRYDAVFQLQSFAKQKLQNLVGGTLDLTRQPRAERAAVVIRRTGAQQPLWDLAKRYKTTAQAIQTANHLTQPEVEAGRLLLIPM